MILLNKSTHHQAIKQAYLTHQKVDFTIDCAVEATMGNVFADDEINPTAFVIQNGPFYIFSGEPKTEFIKQVVKNMPQQATILPGPKAWLACLSNIPTVTLKPYKRFSFDHQSISMDYLDGIIKTSSSEYPIVKINQDIAVKLSKNKDFQYQLKGFSSVNDFIHRGMGYVIMDHGDIIGVASSALVCSKGIEISIMVLSEYRGKSLAKKLAAHLIKEVLSDDKIPRWDAAHEISAKLAQSLGYTLLGEYQAYRISKQ
jgi:GNAT superfamily N-acetyltransferase